MDFAPDADLEELRAAVAAHSAKFTDDYWAEKDVNHEFPDEFLEAMARAGFLGIALPEEYGGGGLGVTAAAIMMQAIAESGGGLSAVAPYTCRSSDSCPWSSTARKNSSDASCPEPRKGSFGSRSRSPSPPPDSTRPESAPPHARSTAAGF